VFPQVQLLSRYAVQLIHPAYVLAQTQGRNEIEKYDLEEIKYLFFDAKASAKLL
jgi:RuvB-like protein 1 (pontin 52)